MFKNKVSTTLEKTVSYLVKIKYQFCLNISVKRLSTRLPSVPILEEKIDEVISFDKDMKQVFEEIEGGLQQLEALSC
ncbi:MAG: hypothetical protein H7A37_01290 [Chlamydiales bacterium]|nr:hypothetical protein [Chlamydiales bacterium]